MALGAVDWGGMDLCGVELREVDISGGNLTGANLVDADLSGSRLCNVNLTGALMSNATLNNVDLTGAKYPAEQAVQEGWLQGAKLGPVRWSGLKLRGGILCNCNMDGAKLNNADLNGADLTKASLLKAEMEGADLTNATLSQAIFDVESWAPKGWLKGMKLHGIDWSNKKLQQAQLQRCDLTNATLSGADLSFASLTGSILDQCEMKGTLLVKSKYDVEQFCAKGWLQVAIIALSQSLHLSLHYLQQEKVVENSLIALSTDWVVLIRVLYSEKSTGVANRSRELSWQESQLLGPV